MVSVRYSHRLICDSSFCLWWCKQPNKEQILSHLMHIKSSSMDCKKFHNIILKPEAILCSEKIDEKYLGAAFKILDEPKFLENYKKRETKNVIFGIELTDETPFKCYLLTSPEKEPEYINNPHNQGIENFKVISGEKALKIIASFYSAFTAARNLDMTRC